MFIIINVDKKLENIQISTVNKCEKEKVMHNFIHRLLISNRIVNKQSTFLFIITKKIRIINNNIKISTDITSSRIKLSTIIKLSSIKFVINKLEILRFSNINMSEFK